MPITWRIAFVRIGSAILKEQVLNVSSYQIKLAIARLVVSLQSLIRAACLARVKLAESRFRGFEHVRLFM